MSPEKVLPKFLNSIPDAKNIVNACERCYNEFMIFKNKTVNLEKLIGYGFEKAGDKFVYSADILDNQFKMTVKIGGNGEMDTELIDLEAEEVYTLHLVADASGEFVGKVRSEYERVLEDIAENCFETDIFRENCARKAVEYARDKYGDELEFLWERYPDAAVLRRKDNKKWYALFMTISKSKLGLDSGELSEIIDLRIDTDELAKKVDGERYFAGYHMNKKHWITMLLDGSVPIEEILACLDNSYDLAK